MHLNLYLEERNQLLRTITDVLERDPEVYASWLFGSIGRGDDDALSDIDLWIVVDDSHMENVKALPRQFFSQIGNPVLFLEAPQNAPEGGAYLMTCFEAPAAPHIVDWYWQPQSFAHIPGQVRLLFDRVGLIHKDQPILIPGRSASQEIIERPVHFISFFWMMLMITAKQVFRFPWEETMDLLPLLIDPIAKAQQFLDQDRFFLSSDIPRHQLPGEKVQLLYNLADLMNEMMASIAERGEEVPNLVTPGAYRYLDLIASIIKDKEK